MQLPRALQAGLRHSTLTACGALTTLVDSWRAAVLPPPLENPHVNPQANRQLLLHQEPGHAQFLTQPQLPACRGRLRQRRHGQPAAQPLAEGHPAVRRDL